MNDERRIRIRTRLLDWYAVEARELPWRKTCDPYPILVSEFMLQQTQVSTVLRYFDRFLERFPSFHALASASIDDVLKAWEGLGYYRRAHNLHRTAQTVVEEHGGRLPATVSELRALPGIGPYTAAAIASIAFGLDEPVLDGNVIRVLTRLGCIPGDPSRAATRRVLLRDARDLANCECVADLNQALMDLGARICLPRSPRCHRCPLSDECDAHHRRLEAAYPERSTRRRIPHIDVVAGIVWDGVPFDHEVRFLVSRRRDEDMLGGLWEFPGGRVEEGESLEVALRRELREELEIDVEVLQPLLEVDHAYTHFRMTLHVFHCRVTSGEPRAIECSDWRWATLEDLADLALSAADRKVVRAIEEAAETKNV